MLNRVAGRMWLSEQLPWIYRDGVQSSEWREGKPECTPASDLPRTPGGRSGCFPAEPCLPPPAGAVYEIDLKAAM